MYRVMSICTGVNGFDLLLDPSRFKVVGFAEVDKFASSVLKYHYPEVENYGDITASDFTKRLPDFDILTGGTPCQSFSIAGNGKGLEGKSGLFFHFIRILKDCQPKYFIWENVKNVISINNGLDFLTIQNCMAEAGYDIRWQVLNSQDFGVLQVRERIYIIGSLRNSTASPIPSEPYGNRRYVKKQQVESIDGQRITAYSKSTRTNKVDHRIRLDGLANTLNTGEGCSNQSTFNLVYSEKFGLRRMTPLECERVMGWPDNWTAKGIINDKEIELSDTQRWKLCGNGVVSPITKFLTEGFLP